MQQDIDHSTFLMICCMRYSRDDWNFAYAKLPKERIAGHSWDLEPEGMGLGFRAHRV